MIRNLIASHGGSVHNARNRIMISVMKRVLLLDFASFVILIQTIRHSPRRDYHLRVVVTLVLVKCCYA